MGLSGKLGAMPYYVFGHDGNKYGPADDAMLRTWVQEGRIIADTWLEDTVTGKRVTAKDLGIVAPTTQTSTYQPYQPPQSGFSRPPSTFYADPATYRRSDPSGTVLILGWISLGLGLFCCVPLFFGSIALILGIVAAAMKNRGGIYLVITAIALTAVVYFVGISFF